MPSFLDNPGRQRQRRPHGLHPSILGICDRSTGQQARCYPRNAVLVRYLRLALLSVNDYVHCHCSTLPSLQVFNQS